MNKSRGALVPSTNRFVAVPSIILLGFAALLSPIAPASAGTRGIGASCSFVSTSLLTCDFPVLSPSFNAEIHYVTAQCNSKRRLQSSAAPGIGSTTEW